MVALKANAISKRAYSYFGYMNKGLPKRLLFIPTATTYTKGERQGVIMISVKVARVPGAIKEVRLHGDPLVIDAIIASGLFSISTIAYIEKKYHITIREMDVGLQTPLMGGDFLLVFPKMVCRTLPGFPIRKPDGTYEGRVKVGTCGTVTLTLHPAGPEKKACTCDMTTLMRKGCTCGGA